MENIQGSKLAIAVFANICEAVYRHRRALFALYFVLLVIFVFFKFEGSVESIVQRVQRNRLMQERSDIVLSVNFTPFFTISSFARRFEFGFHSFAFRFFFANTVCYIPMGFLFPLAFPGLRKFWKTLLVCAAVVLVLKAAQFATYLGSFDVDTIALNVLSCCAGYAAFAGMRAFWRRQESGILHGNAFLALRSR